jgi:hypothetical protein
VVETARASAPDGAEVRVDQESGLVVVRVVAQVRWVGPVDLPSFTVSGRAVAVPEEEGS